MFKKLCKNVYYFFFDLFAILRNFDSKYNFVVLTPRLLSKIIKRSLIFDKLNRDIFIQNIRNDFDLITIYEIFSEENYNLRKFEIWKSISKVLHSYEKENVKPLIIDCGSNIGSSSEYFKRCYRNGQIIMIEPDINNFKFSKKNTSIEERFLINNAISSDEKSLKFSNLSEDNRAYRIMDDGNIDIKSTTVENILKITGNGFKPFLIKIDIEGFEKDLFLKNYQWIVFFDVIMIELHDWMLPNKNNSYNFINAINEICNENLRFDFLISGENLILVKNYPNKR
jgi:FkbM family methyltransferase